jgi:hypothetical protein
MEANHCTGLSGCTCELGCAGGPLVCPIAEYGHGSGCSITGGYVYRGDAIPQLQGWYFYADYCSNMIWSMKYEGAPVAPTLRHTELAPGDGLTINSITSFGEDASGEVYIVDQGGEVFKIVPEPANNLCANSIAVIEGEYDFTNIGATTDGFVDSVNCNFSAYTNVGKDIWYTYTAACTGTATVSLCGADFNSKLAVYAGGDCPASTEPAIACNDAFCGDDAQVSFPATAGNAYKIRVGGFLIGTNNISTGEGTMVITCAGPPSCPSDLTKNGVIDVDDLLIVINNWGTSGPGDINKSGLVDTDDLLEVINHWGPCI